MQGVRPITVAVEQGWTVRALLHDGRGRRSAWATDLMARVDARRSQRGTRADGRAGREGGADGTPELLAVVAQPPDDLDRSTSDRGSLTVVLDRLGSPGNLGTLVRSADAFGAAGVVVTGHAADPYDPQLRARQHRVAVRGAGRPRAVVPRPRGSTSAPGTAACGGRHRRERHGRRARGRLHRPGAARRRQRDVRHERRLARAVRRRGPDPDGGHGEFLNAATAGSLVLYEAMQQRSAGSRHDPAGRPASPDDVPELVAMIRELAEYERALPEVEATEEHLHGTLFADAPAVFGHVLEVDGEVAGMAIWFLNYSTWLGAHNLYLEDLYVRPQHRGGGAGRLLLQTLAEICVQRGYRRLEWWVLDWNPRARLLRRARRPGAHRVDPLPRVRRGAGAARAPGDRPRVISWTRGSRWGSLRPAAPYGGHQRERRIRSRGTMPA